MGPLLGWWRRADHYDWLWAYLERDGRPSLVRVMLIALSASAWLEGPWTGAVPLVLPQPLQNAFSAFLVVAAILFTAMWASRIPTRAQSAAFALTIQFATAVNAAFATDPLVGTFACFCFICMASYIALAHSTRVMLVNCLFTATIMGIVAVRLASSGKPLLAVAASIWFFGICIMVPVGAQLAVQNLGLGAVSADTDALTGLLNRRGFATTINQMFANRRDTHADLLVAVAIDLDRFKALNDTHGHDEGDRALVAVAATLRANTRKTAIISRSGGEEFVVVDVVSQEGLEVLTQRLCDAVAALPYPITASVGTARCPVQGLTDADPQTAVNTLVKAADDAMYTAKRAGGNQVRHMEVDKSEL
jgi:diguanylate cyclase